MPLHFEYFFAKKKIAKLLDFFLKCTLFSHIFMQTDIAFYGSAKMLKFKNDFTKPLNLQRNPKENLFFTLVYFSKKSNFLFVFYKILCVPHGSEKQIRFC